LLCCTCVCYQSSLLGNTLHCHCFM
jgi:hypothetical protein